MSDLDYNITAWAECMIGDAASLYRNQILALALEHARERAGCSGEVTISVIDVEAALKARK